MGHDQGAETGLGTAVAADARGYRDAGLACGARPDCQPFRSAADYTPKMSPACTTRPATAVAAQAVAIGSRAAYTGHMCSNRVQSPPSLPIDVARVVELVRADPDVATAWLFGSAARDQMRADSDIDIAVRFAAGLATAGRPRALGERSALWCFAGRGRPVQVVDVDAVGHQLRYQVLRDGIVLCDRTPKATADLVERTLRERFDWLPMREIERHARDLRDRAADLGSSHG